MPLNIYMCLLPIQMREGGRERERIIYEAGRRSKICFFKIHLILKNSKPLDHYISKGNSNGDKNVERY